jgi:hypothetical protein
MAKTTISPVVKGNQIRIPKQAAFAVQPAKPQSAPSDNPGHSNPSPAASHPPTSHSMNPPANDDYVVTPETYRDWIANVTLEKYALNGSGRVTFFCGPTSSIPSDPSEWHNSPLYVGSVAIFATNPTHTHCENCKQQADANSRIGGSVHLTKTLIRHHVPLSGDAPVTYLTENLHWRISTLAGTEVAREDVPSLKVVVQSSGYEVPDGVIGRRPVRTPWTRHSPVTRGRPGGVDHGDEF